MSLLAEGGSHSTPALKSHLDSWVDGLTLPFTSLKDPDGVGMRIRDTFAPRENAFVVELATMKILARQTGGLSVIYAKLDALGAYYLHPVDALCFSSIGTLVAAPLLGLAPEAAGLLGLFLTFNGIFQHLDVPTPRWLGWVIQRPESHLVHHARDFQWTNYSDLPAWDWLFGTLSNPTARPSGPLGFWDGASARLGDQLLGRDVTVEPRPERVRPVSPRRCMGPRRDCGRSSSSEKRSADRPARAR